MLTSNPRRKINPAAPTGFTLMELLLVIAILGVLTTMALAVLRNANESAQAASTQARISRIEAILNAELESYEVRRLPISRQRLVQYIAANPSTPPVPLNVRLNMLHKRILQDLINIEMPRPLFDSVNNRFLRNPDLGVFPGVELIDSGRPLSSLSLWLNQQFPNPIGSPPLRLSDELRNYRSGTVQSWADPRLAIVSADPDREFNHPAEYLYEILTRIDLDGIPAIETLGASSVADTNGDGFLEVVDAWGEPLLWFIAQVEVKHAPTFPNFPVDPNDITNELYEDVEDIDWTKRDPANNGLPTGYTPLDSTIPRDIQQIRLTVYSSRLNYEGVGSN